MTVVSEANDVARESTAGAVSPATPVYFASISGQPHASGQITGKHRPVPAELDAQLAQALGAKGYLPAGENGAPNLVIVYRWGEWTANGLPAQDVGQSNRRLAIQKIHARAVMAGGQVFANEFRSALTASATQGELNRQSLSGRGGPAANALAQMSNMNDAVQRFCGRSVKTMYLVDQATRNCYFVVVTAYHYDVITQMQGEMAWRTSMTVSTRGLSPRQGIPMLLASASPWFGTDMPEAEIIDGEA